MSLPRRWQSFFPILVVAAGALIGVHGINAAELFWDASTSGDWNTATNWSNDLVPTVIDNVTIDQPGELQISIFSPATAKSFTSQEDIVIAAPLTLASDSAIHGIFTMGAQFVSSPTLTGAGNLAIDGALVWTTGSMQGTGKTTLSAGSISTIAPSTSAGSAPVLSRTIENAGLVSFLPGGSVGMSFNSGTFKNLATGAFNSIASATTSIAASGGLSLFDNAGTFNKYGSAQQTINVPLSNSGTVNVYDGTLVIASGNNSGTINMALGSALSLSSEFTNSGTISIQDYDSVSFSNPSFTANLFTNASGGHLNVMKGNVFLPAISNSGEIHIAAGASAIINNTITSLAGSRITGPGTLSISGFVNNFAGTLELTGELWISSSIGFSANQTIAANFNLTGNVSGAGNLAINGPFTWTGGSMSGAGKTTIAAAAVATLGYSPQFPNSGSITLSRVLENAGTINLTKFGSSGASLNFSSGTLNNLAGASLNFSTENTSGGFNGSGTLNNAGTINVAASSSFGPFNMAAVALNNTGVINIHSGGLSGSINNSGVINMYSGIALPFVNSGTLNFYSGGTVTAQNTINTGTLRILGGTLAITGAQGLGGELNLLPGTSATLDGAIGSQANTTVKISGAGNVALSNFANSTLPFTGQLQTSGVVSINNTVNISTDQNIAGRLAVGPNFASTTLTGSGNLFVAGGLEWTTGTLAGSGKVTLGPQSSSILTAGGTRTLSRSLENAGALTFGQFSAGTTAFFNGTLTNTATGVITIPDSTSITFSQSGGTNAINNAGIVRFIDNPSLNLMIPLNNTGTIDIQRGNVQFSGLTSYTQTGGRLILAGGNFLVPGFTLQGGSIEGFGVIGSSVVSHGVIAPGGPTGSLSLGTLALMSDAITMFDVGGTGKGVTYDSIAASSNSSVGGQLLVNLINHFESSILPSDTFTLLTSGSTLAGAFQNAANGERFFTADGLGSFIVHYGPGSTFDPKNVVLSDFLPFVAGDFDFDGDADGADFIAWQTHFPRTSGASPGMGDADGDGDVDGADFILWQAAASFGPMNIAVPEPAAVSLALLSLIGAVISRRLLRAVN